MDHKSNLKKIAAGLFFVTGLVLVGASVFFIGLDRGLTQPKFTVIALFDEVGGLVEGSPIRISGVNVGLVGGVDFLDEPIEGRSLKVTMNIYKKYEFPFRKCSRVSIKTEGVLGQKLVEISEDHSRKVFDLTKPIIGENPLDVEDMAGVITRTALSLQETSDGVNEVMGEWKIISRKTRRLLNRVEDKLIEGDLFKIF
ncbi:MAG: MCE family protein [Candidatus Omnitrophica bacterium]|nr:MCE family protein [Candidatus Omnitrophota bacterium]